MILPDLNRNLKTSKLRYLELLPGGVPLTRNSLSRIFAISNFLSGSLRVRDSGTPLSTRMIESVKETVNGVFRVLSDDSGIINEEKEYTVVFGDKETFCSCTCRDFRRTQFLCKHFFAVIESNKKQFHDISQLFRDHHFTNLDDGLFGNNEVNENIINESKAAVESPDPEVDDAEVDLHCSDNIGNF